jgi:hypothetical protein
MTAKEQAIELVETMSLATDELGYINTNVYRHKQCALIAVNKIMNAIPFDYDFTEKFIDYWSDVKQEIQQL